MRLLRRLWFRLALWGEARLLPLRIRTRPLSEILALADGPVLPGLTGLSPEIIARRTRGTTRRPWLMARRPCLRQGVLAYRFLRAAGFHPELHFGVEHESLNAARLRAHCWVVLDGQIVLNAPQHPMVTVLRHPVEAPSAAIEVAG